MGIVTREGQIRVLGDSCAVAGVVAPSPASTTPATARRRLRRRTWKGLAS